MKLFLLPLLFLSLAAALPSGGVAQSPLSASPEVELRPGDQVSILVWRKAELSAEDLQVAADGTLRHPLYREVKVTGVTIPVAEQRLRTFLERYEANPQFVLQPLLQVAVGGEVGQPGSYSFAPEVTVAKAVALAGGITQYGRSDRVLLVRNGQEHRLDVSRLGGEWAELPVRSGDQIVVERQLNVFRDVVAPVASVSGAVSSLIILFSFIAGQL